jgi:RNA polymerase sigma-70 factor (ECF subfamily)
MHKFQEMSHAEVAQTLGIAKSTVEKHMIKALRHLTDNWSV